MLQNGFPFRNENFFRMLMAETYFLYEPVAAQLFFRILTADFLPKKNELETEFRFRTHSIYCRIARTKLKRWSVYLFLLGPKRTKCRERPPPSPYIPKITLFACGFLMTSACCSPPKLALLTNFFLSASAFCSLLLLFLLVAFVSAFSVFNSAFS